MKKIIGKILIVCMLCTSFFVHDVYADLNVTVIIDSAAIKTSINGIVKNGRTLAPMDDLFTALGAEYSYNSETKVITASVDDFTVTLEVDSNIADSSRLGYKLDIAPEIVNSTVMVPVRFVSE